jgi:hypothetical protein
VSTVIQWLNGPGLVRVLPSAILFALVLLLLIGDHWMGGAERSGTGRRPLETAWCRVYVALLAMAIGTGAFIVSRGVARNVRAPELRDVGAFWVWGRMLDAGVNPYTPNGWKKYVDPAVLPTDSAGLADVANEMRCVYPPPILPLFAAIGWMPVRVAAEVWLAAQLLCLAASVLLLARLFWPSSGIRGPALALALTLLLPATWFTIDIGQTNFLVLLLALVVWCLRDRPVSGAYIAAAGIVKPLYFVLGLYPLLRRQWRAVAWAGCTIAACCLATIAAFGAQTFLAYFRTDQVNQLDPALFSLVSKQSLLALIVTLRDGSAMQNVSLFEPAYLVGAGVILAITVWTIMRLPRTARGGELAMAILLTMGLIVYPATQHSYSVVLILPLSLLWAMRGERSTRVAWTGTFMALIYAIACYHRSQYSIAANALVWLALIGVGLAGGATSQGSSTILRNA